MSTLYLVRHAQASFMAEDYDVLSELGHEQARKLGQRWADLDMRLDAVYCGPRRRQRHTAEIVGEALADAGLPWPELVVLDDLDEYHAEAMLRRFVPELAAQDELIHDLVESFGTADGRRERARQFEKLFQTVMRRWAENAFSAPDVESFGAFQSRTERVMTTLTEASGNGRQVAAFSSGGCIGTAVGSLLGTTGPTMLELGWTLNNCGICELLFSRARRSLSRYNDIAHLTDPSLWTYR